MPSKGGQVQALKSSVLWKRMERVKNLSKSEWVSLATASLAIVRARLKLVRHTAKEILADLEDQSLKESNRNNNQDADEWLIRTSWALRATAAILPFRTDCLVRAIAADSLLRQHALQPEFHLQAGKDSEGVFGAHIWVSCRGIAIASERDASLATLLGESAKPPV